MKERKKCNEAQKLCRNKIILKRKVLTFLKMQLHKSTDKNISPVLFKHNIMGNLERRLIWKNIGDTGNVPLPELTVQKVFLYLWAWEKQEESLVTLIYTLHSFQSGMPITIFPTYLLLLLGAYTTYIHAYSSWSSNMFLVYFIYFMNIYTVIWIPLLCF